MVMLSAVILAVRWSALVLRCETLTLLRSTNTLWDGVAGAEETALGSMDMTVAVPYACSAQHLKRFIGDSS